MSKLDDATLRIQIDADAARRLARAMEQLYRVSGRQMTQDEALAFLEGKQSEGDMPKPHSAQPSSSITEALQHMSERDRRELSVGRWPTPHALAAFSPGEEIATQGYTVADALIDGRLLWEELTLVIAMLPNPAQAITTNADGWYTMTVALPERIPARSTPTDADLAVASRPVPMITLGFCRQRWLRKRTPDRPLTIWCLDPTQIRVISLPGDRPE